MRSGASPHANTQEPALPLSYTITHSFDGQTFTKLWILVCLLHAPPYTVSATITRKTATSMNGRVDAEFSKAHIDEVYKLAVADGVYRIRVFVGDSSDHPAQGFISAVSGSLLFHVFFLFRRH